MEPRVEKHTAVAGGENKAVTVEPPGLLGIVTQGHPKKNGTNFGAPQRQAQMARFAGIYSVNGESPRITRGLSQ